MNHRSPKMWLNGWDDATAGRPRRNPYNRRDYQRRYDRGYDAGLNPTEQRVRQMKRMVNRIKPGTYPEEESQPVVLTLAV